MPAIFVVVDNLLRMTTLYEKTDALMQELSMIGGDCGVHLLFTSNNINLEDDEAMNQFSYSLKPAVCVTLAKEFYENLVPFLQQNQLTCNDLFFLINLFEGHLNQHLTYSNAAKAEINQPFMTAYTAMRSALFAALEQDAPGLDMDALYDAYSILSDGEGALNAELAMLPAEKRDFLAERAQWQFELSGLGEKVPQ